MKQFIIDLFRYDPEIGWTQIFMYSVWAIVIILLIFFLVSKIMDRRKNKMRAEIAADVDYAWEELNKVHDNESSTENQKNESDEIFLQRMHAASDKAEKIKDYALSG